MKREDHAAYVDKVRQDTRHYLQDLLAENEKLRLRVASLASEGVAFEGEKKRLENEILSLREELEHDRREHERLRRQVADIEGENRNFSEKYVRVEQQNTNLANLYVAAYRLHGTLDRQQVLEAIQEIIINLVGCEEMGIFELDTAASELRLAASFGIDSGRYRRIPVGSGVIGGVARSGEIYLAGQSDGERRYPEEADLTACIPLRIDRRTSGAIAIFRLLPQKVEGLGDLDRELFELLAEHAGVALHCSTLDARNRAGAACSETE